MLKTSAKNSIQLVVASHSEVIASGLIASLADLKDIDIVGVVHSTTRLLTLLGEVKVDVLLLDLGNDGELLNFVQTLSVQYPQLRVLLFCSALKPYIAYQLLGFGIAGIISWNISLSKIHESIRKVVQGRIVLQHEIVSSSLIIYFREGLNDLTERELSALEYVAAGHTNREIAKRMHVATRTVEAYIASVCTKLNVRSRTQAAVEAIQMGLIRL